MESLKILLKANLDIKIKNKAGLTALEIASSLCNIDCCQQLTFYSEGKKLDRIEWVFLFEDDYLIENIEENVAINSKHKEKTQIEIPVIELPVEVPMENKVSPKNRRPVSMIITSNTVTSCARYRKYMYSNHTPSESFNLKNNQQQNTSSLNF